MQRERAKEKDKPSIFGSAKPVDTASREREIEERLQREQQQLQKELLEKEKRGKRASTIPVTHHG